MTTRSKKAETTEPAAEAAPVEEIDFGPLTLAQRLTKARELLGGGVEKKGQNKQVGDGYSFVKASDVSRAVYDALSRVGVYAVPSYAEVEGVPVDWLSRSGTKQFLTRLKVTLRVGKVEDKVGFSITTPQTPETLIVETVGYGADSGDKGPYKAMTGGLKYALLHLLGLATDDDPEATSEAPAQATAPAEPRRVGPRASSQSAEATEAAPSGDPAPTTAVGDDPQAPITTAQSRLIFGKANEAGLAPDQFKALVFFVTGKRSSRQLVSKEVDEILTALRDEAQITRAKQEANFDATVGQTPDPTKDANAEADRIAAEAAALTGGEVVPSE